MLLLFARPIPFTTKDRQIVYSHTYCYWLDIIQFSYHICDDSDDDEERVPEPYTLVDEIRLESVPKGSLAQHKNTVCS